VSIGGGLDVAVGPVGRSASGGASLGLGGLGVNYSYSHARGLYGGISLDGAIILTRDDLNRKFYGTFSRISPHSYLLPSLLFLSLPLSFLPSFPLPDTDDRLL